VVGPAHASARQRQGLDIAGFEKEGFGDVAFPIGQEPRGRRGTSTVPDSTTSLTLRLRSAVLFQK
jgi:hypothetical protein